MPVKTPYEREVLLEHVRLYANRHGQVRLEINRREWTVTSTSDDASARCGSCSRRLDSLTYALRGRTLCASCAQRDIR